MTVQCKLCGNPFELPTATIGNLIVVAFDCDICLECWERPPDTGTEEVGSGETK